MNIMAATAILAMVLCSSISVVTQAVEINTSTSQDKDVECDGNTIIEVDNRIGAQTPFHAIFRIKGDTVTMTEGDFLRFSKSYHASQELTKPDRNAYESKKSDSSTGNLFFFKKSGRFEIFKLDPSVKVTKTEITTGQCKPFTPNDVFE